MNSHKNFSEFHDRVEEQWLLILKLWPLILAVTLLFTVGGYFYASTLPKVYRSTALVVVSPPQSKRIGEIQIDRDMDFLGRMYFIQTQAVVLKSSANAKKAIERITDSLCKSVFGISKDKLSEGALLQALEVQLRKNSDILEVSCMGNSPECAEIVNLVLQVFIEQNEEQFKSQGVLKEWLQKELPEIEKKILKIYETMLKFEEQNVDILLYSKASNTPNALYTDMAELSRQELQKVKMSLLNLEPRYKKCQEARKNNNLEFIMGLDFFEENGILQKLRLQKLDLQGQINEYNLKYTSKHPKIILITTNIEQIDKKIKEEVELFLTRQEEAYKELIQKKESLEKIVQEQLAESLKLKQKYSEYERHRREYESAQKTYNTLLEKMKELDITESYRLGNIKLIEPAKPSFEPFKPNKNRIYLVSLLLGFIIGLSLAYLFVYLDEKVKNIGELQQIVPFTLMGCVPKISSFEFSNGYVAVKQKDNSIIAEAFRTISTSLFLQNKEKDTQRFVISSAMPGDGKTTIVCNLGMTFAKSGHKVLLIDGDLHKPKINDKLALKAESGLSELLQNKVSIQDIIYPVIDNLWCIPAGKIPKDPYQLWMNRPLDAILDQLGNEYQYIFIDSPPLGITSETLLFTKSIKNLILVIGGHHSYKKMLKEIVNRLQNLEITTQGIIFNDVQGKYFLNKKYSYYKY